MPYFERLADWASGAYRSLAMRLVKAAGLPPAGWVERGATTIGADGKVDIQPTDERQIEQYKRSLWVHVAVSRKAAYAAYVPWVLKRARKGTDEALKDHPVIDLLTQPAPGKTWNDLARAIVVYLELAGRAFLEKASEGEGEGPVKQLWPLMPHKMRIITEPQAGVTQFIYTPNLASQVFTPDSIAYWRAFDPLVEDGGVAPMVPAWASNLLDLQAREWNRAFFARGAAPDAIIKSQRQMLPADRKRFKEEWFRGNQGLAKGRGVEILEMGYEYQEITRSHREMQFDRLAQMSREEVLAAFRVPPVLCGLLSDAAYATAWIQLEIFRDYEIVPLVEQILEGFTNQVVTGFDENLYLEVDRSQLLTSDERSKTIGWLVSAIQAGIYTRDEARGVVGLPPLPEEEQPPAAGASAPAGAAGAEMPAPEAGGGGAATAPPSEGGLQDRRTRAAAGARGNTAPPAPPAPAAKKPRIKPDDPGTDAGHGVRDRTRKSANGVSKVHPGDLVIEASRFTA